MGACHCSRGQAGQQVSMGPQVANSPARTSSLSERCGGGVFGGVRHPAMVSTTRCRRGDRTQLLSSALPAAHSSRRPGRTLSVHLQRTVGTMEAMGRSPAGSTAAAASHRKHPPSRALIRRLRASMPLTATSPHLSTLVVSPSSLVWRHLSETAEVLLGVADHRGVDPTTCGPSRR